MCVVLPLLIMGIIKRIGIKVSQKIIKKSSSTVAHNGSDLLIKDISALIDEARSHVAREYNAAQALLCWLIGKRIDEEILNSERAEYGETIVISLAEHLTLLYGKEIGRAHV